MHFVLRYIGWFILFVGIHYLEALPPIGELSVAQLWKLPIMFFCMILLILRRNISTFEKFGVLTFIEAFLCPEILHSPIAILLYASKNLLLVLFFNYWRKYYSYKEETLTTIVYSLAQYIPLSSLLILFGIMDPPYIMSTTDSFGGGEVGYYRGVFGSAHCASSYFCISIILLLTGFINGRFKSFWAKLYNGVLILFCFYSIYNTFVRTGWLMLAVALIFLLDFSKINIKRMSIYMMSIALVLGVVIYLYNNNDAFYGRITGRNIYTETGGDKIDMNGSGRTQFWKNAVIVWTDGNLYEALFGSGLTKVKAQNLRTTGMPVISHSQFFDQLAQYGLVGLLLLILYYFKLYKYIWRFKRNKYSRTCKSLYMATIVFCFFQNEPYFIYVLLFSALIVLTSISNSNLQSQ